ncbi:YkgJ family cysteine cluster protein [Selenomonas sputigena]|uniref:YkgJ family cysteine cluster protein n=1 Tax=Selenomonas sputigena TaxID=69823 RepID=UPI0028F16806|nr:YkgJ family cysteine cluster protein [Selenomonas sputigena]
MFHCTQCGECCKQVGMTIWGKNMALPNGICKWLDDSTNLCTIYQHRPLMCNVDAFYEENYAMVMSREEFYALNRAECLKLQSMHRNC